MVDLRNGVVTDSATKMQKAHTDMDTDKTPTHLEVLVPADFCTINFMVKYRPLEALTFPPCSVVINHPP